MELTAEQASVVDAVTQAAAGRHDPDAAPAHCIVEAVAGSDRAVPRHGTRRGATGERVTHCWP